MKNARKWTSLLLALLLVFALAATAAADGADAGTTTYPGSITVDNPQSETNYTAYKIFDMVYDDAQNPQRYSYTIKDDSEWYGTVSTYATETNGLKLTQVTGTTTYVVTTTNDFSAPKFAAALNAAVNGKTGRPLRKAESANTATVSGLPLGYYFVTSTSGALCNLTTTAPHINIRDKNDVPFNKEGNKPSADVGQTVTYKITGKVPDYTGFDTYIYEITDTMSQGLTFDNASVNVTIDDANVDSGPNGYTLKEPTATDTDKYTFKLSINVRNFAIGKNIVVTYNATVNKNAIAKIENNKATLTYTNGPTVNDVTTITPPDDVKVYTSKIVIEKVEKIADGAAEGTTAKKLKDAEFVLYKEVTPDGATSATKQYYKWTEDEKVEWVANKDQADVKRTGENGEASFDGLADGTYYLVETKAPAGYNQMTEAQKVEVHVGEHAVKVTNPTQLSVTAKVENQAGTLLPSTGGMGTTVFYVLGAVLVLGAGVLLVTKKRMSRNEG